MDDRELRSKVIRLAKVNPHLRPLLLPLLKEAKTSNKGKAKRGDLIQSANDVQGDLRAGGSISAR
jgi:hypothetical protein